MMIVIAVYALFAPLIALPIIWMIVGERLAARARRDAGIPKKPWWMPPSVV